MKSEARCCARVVAAASVALVVAPQRPGGEEECTRTKGREEEEERRRRTRGGGGGSGEESPVDHGQDQLCEPAKSGPARKEGAASRWRWGRVAPPSSATAAPC